MKFFFCTSLTLVTIFICGCTSQLPTNLTIDKEQTKIKLQIPEIKESMSWRYSDVFSKVDFIPLEATPESLVGDIQDMEITAQIKTSVATNHSC